MSILINKDTKVITQGITGKTGQFHTEKCIEYANGKNCFVAGVNPKKAGEKILDVPIYGLLSLRVVGLVSVFDFCFHQRAIVAGAWRLRPFR